MAAGAIVRVGGPQVPRLAGLFSNVLRPAARFVEKNPIRAMAGVGGLQGGLTEGWGGIPGGALGGAMWGWGMGGPLANAPIGRMTRGLTGMGVAAPLAKNLAAVAPAAGLTAATLFTGRGAGNAVVNTAGGSAGNVLGAGASKLNQQPNVVSMSDLPQGFSPKLEQMFQGPEGNWWYNLNPGGLPAGQRLGRQLGAQTDASVLNTLGNALYGQTERVAKSELARQAAAYQLKANIDMARDMALNSQASGLNIAQNAGQSMGNAMSNRSMFRYI